MVEGTMAVRFLRVMGAADFLQERRRKCIYIEERKLGLKANGKITKQAH